jgi:hypothetical protein
MPSPDILPGFASTRIDQSESGIQKQVFEGTQLETL